MGPGVNLVPDWAPDDLPSFPCWHSGGFARLHDTSFSNTSQIPGWVMGKSGVWQLCAPFGIPVSRGGMSCSGNWRDDATDMLSGVVALQETGVVTPTKNEPIFLPDEPPQIDPFIQVVWMTNGELVSADGADRWGRRALLPGSGCPGRPDPGNASVGGCPVTAGRSAAVPAGQSCTRRPRGTDLPGRATRAAGGGSGRVRSG